jgi:hypothetical protein
MGVMGVLGAGVVVLLIVGTIFWRCLPKDGVKYRFADTEWEPYFGVALTAGVALGFACVLKGIFTIMAG